MKLFPEKPRKRVSSERHALHASAARHSARDPVMDEEEPTTSFKTTLIVAVLLHVVAAGGIFMFESIKKKHPNAFEATPPPVTQKATPAPQARVATVQQKPTAVPVAASESSKKPTPAPEIKDSGKTYMVAKGDTAVTIAKKFQVAYDELLKLNRIEDPKKLRPGQKLRIPIKTRVALN